MTLKLCVVVALFACLAGCPQPPSPPVPDADATPPPADAAPPSPPSPLPLADSSPASAVVTACANLQAAGCPEGDPHCPKQIQQALDDRVSKKITPQLVLCVASAGVTAAAIRACGSGWCPVP